MYSLVGDCNTIIQGTSNPDLEKLFQSEEKYGKLTNALYEVSKNPTIELHQERRRKKPKTHYTYEYPGKNCNENIRKLNPIVY